MATHTVSMLSVRNLPQIGEDGSRFEVIQGELHVSTAPSVLHQFAVNHVAFALTNYIRATGLGAAIPGVGLIFDSLNGFIPDLVFVSHERGEQNVAGGRLIGPPEIVVEVLSPGWSNENRDHKLKREVYAEHGVLEYWIVDPQDMTVQIHARDAGGSMILSRTLTGSDELTSPVLPGFRLPLVTLFERPGWAER